MTSERILIVDDVPANIRVLAEVLEPRGYEILTASSAADGLRIARASLPDLILLDVVMPGEDGFWLCGELTQKDDTSRIPVLFVTAKDEPRSVLRGLRSGAVDYIPKPFYVEEVLARVETHLKIARLTRTITERNRELECEILRRQEAEAGRSAASERLQNFSEQEMARWGVAGLIGKSRLLRKILTGIERLHQFSGTNVLITGESGTGKELVARAIHYGSPRARGPFIPVNCVAIPVDLAESLFFGHVRGAFTGAVADKKGCFEMADGGTLFLDEIGDMAPALQAKLLRVLEDGSITPVGAAAPRRVDVRVVAATNADIGERIADGNFREDLYFRLARYIVEMPPLRDRAEDVPLLAEHFLRIFAAEMGVPEATLTPEALCLLKTYAFPGNVRELKNMIERALIESEGQAIGPAHLRMIDRAPRRAIKSAARGADADANLPLNLEDAEQVLIQRALHETAGNVMEAARLLGVNRSRIYRRFRQPVQ